MTLDGNRLRTASRLLALGAALLVIRAAVACGGSASDSESDSCKQRQGHCASGGLTATCTREEVAFVDTCLCCVPANLVMSGDDDDDTSSDAAADTGPGNTDDTGAGDASDAASGDGGDSGSADAADGSG